MRSFQTTTQRCWLFWLTSRRLASRPFSDYAYGTNFLGRRDCVPFVLLRFALFFLWIWTLASWSDWNGLFLFLVYKALFTCWRRRCNYHSESATQLFLLVSVVCMRPCVSFFLGHIVRSESVLFLVFFLGRPTLHMLSKWTFELAGWPWARFVS